MASKRLQKTLVDYVAIALSPALIVALVGSLMFFLLETAYSGGYQSRLTWIMGCFVIAIVLITRIAMEEGAERAGLYGLALSVAVGLAIMRFVEGNPLVAFVVMGVVWWSAHKLTQNCTLIDDTADASGEGLLQIAGLSGEQGPAKGAVEQPGKASPLPMPENPADNSRWRRIFGRQRRPTSAPGLWVVYYSLAALPLFGIGQRWVPSSDLAARRYVFWLLCIYVASALGLLLTTSFLGLRRYLRQRKLEMPAVTAGMWLGMGAALIVLLLAAATLVPRPDAEYAVSSVTGQVSSQDHSASDYASLHDTGQQQGAGTAGKAEEGQPAEPSNNTPPRSDGQSGDSQPAQPGGNESPSGDSSSSNSAAQNDSSQGQAQAGDKGQAAGQSQAGKPNQHDSQEKSSQPQSGSGKSSKQKPGEQKPGEQQASAQGQAAQGQNASPQPGEAPQQQPQQAQPQPEQPPQTEPSEPWQMPDIGGWLFVIVRWIFNLIILAAVVYLAIRYRQSIVEGFRQLLQSWRNFWQTLFGRQHSMTFAEGESVDQPVVATPLPFASYPNPFVQTLPGVTSPEELVSYSFKALEAWAADHGHDRRQEETPFEFANRLGESQPQVAEAARDLANLYVRAAYAGRRLPDTSITAIRQFWQSLSATVQPAYVASPRGNG